MEKLKMHSPDFTQENIAKLAGLFPNCVTEAKSEDGTVKRAIDFDQLRQELSTSIVEGPQERYQLNWPGKREALLTANAPIAKTLRPCREESVDFDTTQNLFIEGDNLDALKLLQEGLQEIGKASPAPGAICWFMKPATWRSLEMIASCAGAGSVLCSAAGLALDSNTDTYVARSGLP